MWHNRWGVVGKFYCSSFYSLFFIVQQYIITFGWVAYITIKYAKNDGKTTDPCMLYGQTRMQVQTGVFVGI